MNILIGIINLFITPFISVGIYTTRFRLEKRFSFNTAMLYAVFTPMNVLFSRAVVWIAEKVSNINARQDTAKYSAFAIVTAIVLPLLAEVIKKYIKAECKIKAKEENDNSK